MVLLLNFLYGLVRYFLSEYYYYTILPTSNTFTTNFSPFFSPGVSYNTTIYGFRQCA